MTPIWIVDDDDIYIMAKLEQPGVGAPLHQPGEEEVYSGRNLFKQDDRFARRLDNANG